jgi:diguanylate cyclase (GGDEF)-like protein
LATSARAAETDPLTGIGNRRWLITQGQEQITRAQRGQIRLSVTLFDLDRFKSINDQYGHAKGDAVLVAVARVVKGQLRSSHLFGRLGGEEFGIILPKTSLEDAVALATRIQNSLSIHSVAQLRTGAVTASFGVTEWQADDRELSPLLRRADDLLYQAKRDGRNQVVAADVDA